MESNTSVPLPVRKKSTNIDTLEKETCVELVKPFVQKNLANHVSSEPPFPRVRARPAKRDRPLGTRM